MNFRTTLILMCLLIAVGIVVVLTQKHDASTSSDTTATTDTGTKLFDLQQPDITKISFTDETGQQVVLEKTDFKWSITSPVKGPADDSAVTTLLSAVTSADSRGKIDAGSATGLDAPSHKVELTTKAGKTVSFDVGSKSATGEVVYIKRSGQQQADVTAAGLADAFDKPLKDFRRAKLLDVGSTEIKQLRVASTQPTMELQKQGENWSMTQPVAEPVDTYAVSDLTSAAANLRADEFVSDTGGDDAKYGLDQPVMTVTFNTQGPVLPPATAPTTQTPPTIIKFGRYTDILKTSVFASINLSSGVFKVSTSTLNVFHKSPLELRDKRATTIDPAKVTKIEMHKDLAATTQPTTRPASSKTTILAISQEEAKGTTQPTTSTFGSEPTTAATTGPARTSATQPATVPSSKWNIVSKDNMNADDSSVDDFLKQFNPLRVERYEPTAPTESAVDTWTVTLTVGDKTETLKFSSAGTTKPLQGEYNGLFFVVSRDMIDQLDSEFDKPTTPAATGRPMPTMMPGMQ